MLSILMWLYAHVNISTSRIWGDKRRTGGVQRCDVYSPSIYCGKCALRTTQLRRVWERSGAGDCDQGDIWNHARAALLILLEFTG